jgi:hypothetical protein
LDFFINLVRVRVRVEVSRGRVWVSYIAILHLFYVAKMTSGQFAGWKIVLTCSYCQNGVCCHNNIYWAKLPKFVYRNYAYLESHVGTLLQTAKTMKKIFTIWNRNHRYFFRNTSQFTFFKHVHAVKRYGKYIILLSLPSVVLGAKRLGANRLGGESTWGRNDLYSLKILRYSIMELSFHRN